MTYLDAVYRYEGVPGENQMRAIDGVREVYGILLIKFDEKERIVRVRFDASRMKEETVAHLLRQSGLDIREKPVLA